MNTTSDDPSNPLPLEPLNEKKEEERRLWLGNLDTRITEYQLIKLLQKHGSIEKFDLLFHRSGPMIGQPRGYAFVTYLKIEDARRAKLALDSQMVGYRRMVVRWANSVSDDELINRPKPELEIPVLAGTNKPEKKISPATTIQAIEAKLKMMEHNNQAGSFEVTNIPSVSTDWPIYQYRPPIPHQPTFKHRGRGRYDSRPNRRPYQRRR